MTSPGRTASFSVVIPSHGRPEMLRRALASVWAQSEPCAEIIVVDDASPDPVPQSLVDESRVPLRVVRNDANRGPGACRNLGAELAAGTFVVFLDDDDELMPRFVEVARRELTDRPATLGFGWAGVSWSTENGAVIRTREEIWRPRFVDREEAYRRFLVHRRVGSNCGLFVRPEALAAVGGFDEELRGAEDTELLIRMAREYDFHVLPEVLVRIHLHAGTQLRRDTTTRAACYEAILTRNAEVVANDSRVRSAVHYKTAWLQMHAGSGAAARRHSREAFKAEPRKLRNWLMVALALLPSRMGAATHLAIAGMGRRFGHGPAS